MNKILPLTLKDVCYRVGEDRLLQDINLHFEAGPVTLVIGPNGAGKSLLLRVCHGLIAPETGSISWGGSDAPHAAKYQALVFQKPILLRRSVQANIAFPLRVAGVLRDREIDARVEDALKLAGLEHIADRPAKVLSGGEQQKLALARARAQRPEVLFLDEPTANLDPRSLKDVEALILALHDSGTKIIMTSHDMAQVKRLADEIVFIYDGRIVEAGPAEKVLQSRHIKY